MKYRQSFNLDIWIKNQLKLWEDSKNVKEKPKEPKPFVTISREYGCNAVPISLLLEKKLNELGEDELWSSYDKELLKKIEEDHDVSEALLETIDTQKRTEMAELMRTMLTDYPPQVSAYKRLIQSIRTLALNGKSIILGRAGVIITKGMKYGLHVRLIAPISHKISIIKEEHNIKDRHEAEKLIKEKDKERHGFLTQYIKFDAYNPTSYDLTINIERFSKEEIVDIIIAALKSREWIK